MMCHASLWEMNPVHRDSAATPPQFPPLVLRHKTTSGSCRVVSSLCGFVPGRHVVGAFAEGYKRFPLHSPAEMAIRACGGAQ